MLERKGTIQNLGPQGSKDTGEKLEEMATFRRNEAIAKGRDLGGKKGFVVKKKVFPPFLSPLSGEGPGGFCWDKPNWGRTGDQERFLLQSWGRGLGKQISDERETGNEWFVNELERYTKKSLMERKDFCWKAILDRGKKKNL